MRELLANAIEAHGGIERWQELAEARATIVSGGLLFDVKGLPQDPAPREMTVRLHEEHASVRPFGSPDQRTDFTPGRVTRLLGHRDRVVARRRRGLARTAGRLPELYRQPQHPPGLLLRPRPPAAAPRLPRRRGRRIRHRAVCLRLRRSGRHRTADQTPGIPPRHPRPPHHDAAHGLDRPQRGHLQPRRVLHVATNPCLAWHTIYSDEASEVPRGGRPRPRFRLPSGTSGLPPAPPRGAPTPRPGPCRRRRRSAAGRRGRSAA